MKILVLSNCPVVASQGSGHVIISTINSLRNEGHNVELIPPTAFSFASGLLEGKGNIYRMAIGMALWMHRSRKVVTQFDLVILYGAESSIALFVLKFLVRSKVPVVLHSNGLELHVRFRLKNYGDGLAHPRKWYQIDNSFLFKYCYNNVDAIITVSKYDKYFATNSMKISGDKVYSNEPCLPDIYFEEDKNMEYEKKPIITYCGTWIPRKGIESIKSSIPNILRKFPNYSFRVIGVGNNFIPSDHFPEDILGRIEVFPLVQNKKEIIKLYMESEVFLFPSLSESFGLVVAEAMFCKCAVVTGPTGFAADLENNEEAIVLKEPNSNNVYSAVERIIIDNELKEKLSKKGRKRTEQLTRDNYSSATNQIINKIVQRGNLRSLATI